ncbi:MAG TPA: hypothetical protein VFZ62_01085 [Candidatus Saccharimonadales bacterium]
MADDPNDEQYKQATRVVDDAMRTDALGPNLVRVLKDHKPAHDLLHEIVKDCIKSDTDVKDELSAFMADYDAKRKGKWVDRALWLVVGAAITGVIAWIVTQLLGKQ